MVLRRVTSARSLGGAEVPSSRMALGASLVNSPQSGIVQPIVPHCQVGSGDSQCERRLRDIPEDAWKKTTLRCGNILPQPRDLHSSTLDLATGLLLGGSSAPVLPASERFNLPFLAIGWTVFEINRTIGKPVRGSR